MRIDHLTLVPGEISWSNPTSVGLPPSGLAASTMPDQLSQLRKLRLNGRGCAGAGASGIAAIIYGWFEKSPRIDLVIADFKIYTAIF